MRVLAHFVPGHKVLDFVAPESDWLDVRWCAEDDDTQLYRELPHADVIWHVLRPLSGDDVRRGTRLRPVHKLGAGVNTIDVAAAAERGIAVADMPGANAASVAAGAVPLMSPASGRCPQPAARRRTPGQCGQPSGHDRFLTDLVKALQAGPGGNMLSPSAERATFAEAPFAVEGRR